MAAEKKTLCDPFGRQVNSLRVSLTQRCNFQCFFCHMEGEQNASEEFSTEELEQLVKVASSLGISKVKLTGGEPLLRGDIVDIVSAISPYLEEVSMTTNGLLLERYAEKLHEAGLKRVNISLHSLDPMVFKKITGCQALEDVKRGIEAAIASKLDPVKLNMVALNGLNQLEIPRLIEFSKAHGAILQLIEFQPIQEGTETLWEDFYCDLKRVEQQLEADSAKVHVREFQRRKQYYLRDGAIVEVVRPMHNTGFCQYCTRLRVTSDGKLKPCLMRNDNLVNVLPLLKENAATDALIKAFEEAVARRAPYWRY